MSSRRSQNIGACARESSTFFAHRLLAATGQITRIARIFFLLGNVREDRKEGDNSFIREKLLSIALLTPVNAYAIRNVCYYCYMYYPAYYLLADREEHCTRIAKNIIYWVLCTRIAKAIIIKVLRK